MPLVRLALVAALVISFFSGLESANSYGPTKYRSRTDLNTVQLPLQIPEVGNLRGANTVIVDPDFGNRIVRVTDAGTNPANPNRTYTTPPSADDNVWNLNSTLFTITDTGGNGIPFSFDPSTMQVSRLYAAQFRASGGIVLPNAGVWSRADPSLLYIYRRGGRPVIETIDFGNGSNPPTLKSFYSFSTSSQCLGEGFRVTWTAPGGVSAGDTVLGAAYSNAGGQGTGVYMTAYRAGSGCRVWNTETGQITGDWGETGEISTADRFTVHNAKLSKDGRWFIVVRQKCLSRSCSGSGIYFWKLESTSLSACVNSCGGHWTEGYSHWVNNDTTPVQELIRSFSTADTSVAAIPQLPANLSPPNDQHPSWNNVNSTDDNPVLATTFGSWASFPSAWYNEVVGVATDRTGTVWRFCHTFATAQSHRFSTRAAIGAVSQDGRFFVFSSDWMGMLGSEDGTPRCTVGKSCRGDVFIVELR